MSDFIKNFISKNKSQFIKYKAYIENNDWTEITIDSSLDDKYFSDLYSEDPTKVKKAEITKLLKEQIKQQQVRIDQKSAEYALQNDLISNILNRVVYFVKKTEGEHNTKTFKKFIDFCMEIINI